MLLNDRVVFLKDVVIDRDGMVLFTIRKGDLGAIVEVYGNEKNVPYYIIQLDKGNERVGIPAENIVEFCKLA